MLPIPCRQDEAVHALVWTGLDPLEGVFKDRLGAVPLDAGRGDDDAAAPELADPKPVAVVGPGEPAGQRRLAGPENEVGDLIDAELIAAEGYATAIGSVEGMPSG